MGAFFRGLPLVGLAGLVVHMVRATLRDSAAKHCQYAFEFYPEGKLTDAQFDIMRQKILQRRGAYQQTVSRAMSQRDGGCSAEVYEATDFDIDCAALDLSSAFDSAKRVCKYFSSNPKGDIARFRELAWPNTTR